MQAPAPSTDLGPHLRRELSSYVDQRIVQATAPLQQEVDTLRADKEALTPYVSTQLTGLAALGTPPAQLPAEYPTQLAYAFYHLCDPPSSDDSNNSEQLDNHIADDLHQPSHTTPPPLLPRGLPCLPHRTSPPTGTTGSDRASHAGPIPATNVGTGELPAYDKHGCNNVRHSLTAAKLGNFSAQPSALPHRPSPSRASLSAQPMNPQGSDRDEVAAGLRHLLDNWIPPAEKTTRPRYMDTGLEADRQKVPHIVRDWLLHDMDRPDEVARAFQTNWDTYHYDEGMQARCDRSLHTRVSPGYRGVLQELWIAAPICIRDRERAIINVILRTGLVPPILGRKQMIYLAKSATAHGVINLDPGLPPWRPITV
ncbi:hypothetical protein DYB28_000707 [Aphanomyces astaci]|uniref:Uncharacterized protein n=1 Tax=Aphanomyces astaci TaxID=112090 RepID=A0A9X8E2L7_APHAT|nr:hypothetical protein DYB28_000707 [Aphanomyces astaci]